MIYFIMVILVIKDFRTISQQVEILKNKGLIIDDVNKAENILLSDIFFGHLFKISGRLHRQSTISNKGNFQGDSSWVYTLTKDM